MSRRRRARAEPSCRSSLQSDTGPSFIVRPKNGSIASHATGYTVPSLPFTCTPESCPSSPSQAGHLAEREIHRAVGDELAHLVDAVGRGAEIVAAMHQRQALGQRLQIERPVERRVAAADDQDVLVAELLHLAHGVEHRLRLVGLDAGDRRTLGLERAAAGRDDDDLRLEHLAGVGGDAEQRIADALEARSPSRRDGRSGPNGLICASSASTSPWPLTSGMPGMS